MKTVEKLIAAGACANDQGKCESDKRRQRKKTQRFIKSLNKSNKLMDDYGIAQANTQTKFIKICMCVVIPGRIVIET